MFLPFLKPGFSCAFVPGKSILLNNALLSWVSLARSSPPAPSSLASSTAALIRLSCLASRRMISSFSPLRSLTKGAVHGSATGKLNLSFCFGVLSACRKTRQSRFRTWLYLSWLKLTCHVGFECPRRSLIWDGWHGGTRSVGRDADFIADLVQDFRCFVYQVINRSLEQL